MQDLEPGELHIFELSDMKGECSKGKLHFHDGTVTVKLDMLVVIPAFSEPPNDRIEKIH